MTAEPPDPSDDPPVPSGAEADDAAWLLARARGVRTPPPSAATEVAYERLEDLIGALPATALPAGWQADLLRKIDQADALSSADAVPADPPSAPVVELTERSRTAAPRPRARRRLALGGIAVAVAIAAAVALWVGLRRRGAPEPPPLAYVIRPGDGVVRGDDAVRIGDHVEVTARHAGPVALRLYRDDRVLVVECPGDAACDRRQDGARTSHTLRWRLAAPGRYRIMLVVGDAPPTTGGYDDDYRNARAAGLTVLEPPVPAFDVR